VKTLSYVGGNSAAGSNAAFSVSLTALTGGSGSTAQAGDIVIVVSGWSGTVDGNPGIATAGYTEVSDLYANDTRDANLSVSYKIMGATPDTTVSVNGSGGTAGANGSVAVVHVWRGVDTVTPMDVSATTATGTNAATIDNASITPVTAGAIVLAAGLSTAAASAGDTSFTAPTGYSNAVMKNGNGTSLSVQAGIASKSWSSGAENPAAWSNITTSTSDSWAAVTLALRPGPDPMQVSQAFFEVPQAAATSQDIDPTGLASAEAFGTLEVKHSLSFTGIASAEAFGTAELDHKLTFTGIASTEAFGTTSVQPQPVNVSPTGIASAEGFGTAVLTQVSFIMPNGLASAEAFGTAELDQVITGTGIGSAEAFGTLEVQHKLTFTGIASSEQFGTTRIDQVVSTTGIASVEAFGTASVQPQPVDIVPSGIASAEAFGTAQLNQVAPQIIPSGIATTEAFGTAQVSPGTVNVSPTGIASVESFGALRIDLELDPATIPSAEAFGSLHVDQVITGQGVASQEAFGTLKTEKVVTVSGIPSAEAFGSVHVDTILIVDPQSIPSAEQFGTANVSTGGVFIVPNGVASAEAFGTFSVQHTIIQEIRVPQPELDAGYVGTPTISNGDNFRIIKPFSGGGMVITRRGARRRR
jgi:hypothetical protein